MAYKMINREHVIEALKSKEVVKVAILEDNKGGFTTRQVIPAEMLPFNELMLAIENENAFFFVKSEED
ncbi:hypothetical protein [Enterocloster lavalensis]|uniref:hypothetical protein n=1 Tax=Enterocloster lavalensis TaxID=460384 RepID=UPI002665DC40|nr:hypothetical protein [Enterocloster lavalensis]